MQRRLAAIMAADVVGYSRLMEKDETGTLALLKDVRSNTLDPSIAAFGGRVVKLMGDGALVEFASVIDAVDCAIRIQKFLAEKSGNLQTGGQLQFRIGINIGDIIIDGDDIYGDGVNLAARLEAASAPGGICLSSAAVEQVRGHLEADFVELAPLQLKNISRPIQAFAVAGLGASGADAAESGRNRETHRPSVAVLSFSDKSGDPGTEALAQGITEDLTTSLSRFRELFVIAHRSSRAFDTASSDPSQVAKQLGVRYLVEGSLRRSGRQIRLSVHVIDAPTGESLWSERLDRSSDDLFELQDELVEAIVRTLVRKISLAELERLRSARPKGLQEYELVLQARSLIADTPERNEESRRLYLAAIEQDPNYADAWAGLSGTHLLDWTSGWAEDPHAALEKARETARKSLQLEPANSEAHRRMGLATLMSRDYSSAKHHLNRSVELNPNAASGWVYLCLFHIYEGASEAALDCIARAMRHDPFHDSFYFWFLGLALFGAERFEEAIVPLKQAIQQQAGFIAPHRHLAACYGMLGWMEPAEAERKAVLALNPDFRISDLARTLVYRDQKSLVRYLDGLRRANLPE
jgi:adenylate cyclase